MAPRFVLLLRQVQFIVVGGPTGGSSEKEAANIRMSKATEATLQDMKPKPSVFEPPEVSRLTILQQMRGGGAVPPSHISSSDKALVILYAGQYRSGPSGYSTDLVYDASTDSLSVVPKIPPSCYFHMLKL